MTQWRPADDPRRGRSASCRMDGARVSVRERDAPEPAPEARRRGRRSSPASSATTTRSMPQVVERGPLAAQHDPARAARPGQEPAAAQPRRRCSMPLVPGGGAAARSTTTRSARSASAAATSSPSAATTRRSPGSTPGRSLRREAGHARRDHRRHHRRRGPHPAAARRPRPGQRAHHALRPRCRARTAASSRSTSCPTSPAASRSASSTSSRKATSRSRATRSACRIDVCMVFTANPEDYTARGKIITPLEGPHRQRDPHALPGDPRAGRRHHPAGGLDRAGRRAARARATCARWWRGGLRGPPRQEDRQAERGQPAPAHQRASRTRSRNAERRGLAASEEPGGAADLRHLRRAARPSPASSSSSTRAS